MTAGALVGAAGFYAIAKVFGSEEPEPVKETPVYTNGAATAFVKRAAPAALATISHYFPNAMQDESFVRATAHELFNLGFSRFHKFHHSLCRYSSFFCF